jgi:hypothetical protein
MPGVAEEDFWGKWQFRIYGPGEEYSERALRLILDMDQVRQADISVVCYLAVIAGQQKKMGGKVVLVRANNTTITNSSAPDDLQRVFSCFDTVEEAAASFATHVHVRLGGFSTGLADV